MDEPLITIYTIGHSHLSTEQLLELLNLHQITLLVDVRSAPYSQFAPQFNRETLEASLQSAGLKYKYAGNHLGGRPKDPDCYKDGHIPEGKADYLHLVDYPMVMTKDFFQKGINHLINLAQDERVAVMCSEEDPAICHRHHLIGRYLTDQGITVWHIRADGNKVRDQVLPNLRSEPPVEQPTLF